MEQLHGTPSLVGEGLKLVWGKNWQGRLSHVSDVPSGRSCNCSCPACDQPLIARRGVKRRHHFAHAITGECSQAPSLARIILTQLARQALQGRPTLHLPALTFTPPSLGAGHEPEEQTLRPSFTFTPDRILDKDEPGLSNLPIDMILEGGGQRLGLVFGRELTHEEIEQLKHAGVPTVTYDLVQLVPMSISLDEITEALSAIERSKDGKWLFSRVINSRLEEELADFPQRQAAYCDQLEKDEKARELSRVETEEKIEKEAKRRRAIQVEQVAREYVGKGISHTLPSSDTSHSLPTTEHNTLIRQQLRIDIVQEVDNQLLPAFATLANHPEEIRNEILREARQGAWSRLESRLPVSHPAWATGELRESTLQLALSGAYEAVRYACRRLKVPNPTSSA